MKQQDDVEETKQLVNRLLYGRSERPDPKKERRERRVVRNYTVLYMLFMFAALWLIASTFIFRLRHPWATETEIFLHLPDAIMLREVPRHEYPTNTL